jgi:hypothetical protein
MIHSCSTNVFSWVPANQRKLINDVTESVKAIKSNQYLLKSANRTGDLINVTVGAERKSFKVHLSALTRSPLLQI